MDRCGTRVCDEKLSSSWTACRKVTFLGDMDLDGRNIFKLLLKQDGERMRNDFS